MDNLAQFQKNKQFLERTSTDLSKISTIAYQPPLEPRT
jgi:hypothetical protein